MFGEIQMRQGVFCSQWPEFLLGLFKSIGPGKVRRDSWHSTYVSVWFAHVISIYSKSTKQKWFKDSVVLCNYSPSHTVNSTEHQNKNYPTKSFSLFQVIGMQLTKLCSTNQHLCQKSKEEHYLANAKVPEHIKIKTKIMDDYYTSIANKYSNPRVHG